MDYETSHVSPVRWRILGSVQARKDDVVLDLGPHRQRMVLAVILAAAGQPVPMSELVDVLWGDHPPDYAVNVVHRHVGALRRLVEPALPRRAQGSWLVSYSTGYRAKVDGGTLDLARFRDLMSQTREAHGDDAALDLLLAGLDLWSGPVAADLRGTPTVDPIFHALDQELASAATEAGIVAERAGCPERAVAALQLAARVNASDERVHAQLMRCLAGAGRRDEAFHTYRQLTRVLGEELGVDPSDALRAAHDDIRTTGFP